MANRLDKKNSIFFRSVIAAAVILIGLMTVTFWRLQHPDEPQYFAVQIENGQKQFTRLQSFSGRIFTREDLLLWVQEVVGNIYTFNAVTYKQRFNDILANDFTADGASSFRQALDSSQLLKQVTTQQLNVTGIVSGQPVILKEGQLMGRYTWKIQMPVLLTFESASQTTVQSAIVTILVVNIPTSDSPQAVAIQDFWSQSY
jgi:intracellular multiplication protein IcmL